MGALELSEEEIGLILLGLASIQITTRVADFDKADQTKAKILDLMKKVENQKSDRES